jgi:outer membrane lipoprotein-sorting protein
MKKFFAMFALLAVVLTGCKKEEEVEPKNQPMQEYVQGDWNFYKVNLTGQISVISVTGTGTAVSGKWTFRADGTFRAETKYTLEITSNGQSLGSETIDEVLEGTYTTTETSIVVVADGETTTYTVVNRENTSFDLNFSDVITDPAPGTLNITVGLRR